MLINSKGYVKKTDEEILSVFFFIATSQSQGLPETLVTAYNPGMCFLDFRRFDL